MGKNDLMIKTGADLLIQALQEDVWGRWDPSY